MSVSVEQLDAHELTVAKLGKRVTVLEHELAGVKRSRRAPA